MSRVLSHDQARQFYDRFGTLQDLERFYANPAHEALLAHADFEHARSVVEVGCGTGAMARTLLEKRLPPEATYLGLDVSAAMIEATRKKIETWSDRARAQQTEGEPRLPVPDRSCDRILSVYVLDLLSSEDITALLAEARRALAPEGALGVVSMTHGEGTVSRGLCRAWSGLHDRWPALVGGCRPLRLADHLGDGWRSTWAQTVCSFGFCSEVLVASPA